jgi:hypothetical protein
VFAKLAVVGAESGEEVGVDIEFAGNFAVNEDGDDDFGLGFERAGEITRIGIHVVDNDGFAGRCRRTTDTLIEWDASVRSYGAFEGAENEDILIAFFFEHVEADPIVGSELLVKDRDNAFHQGFCGSRGIGEGIESRDQVGRFGMCGGHRKQSTINGGEEQPGNAGRIWVKRLSSR